MQLPLTSKLEEELSQKKKELSILYKLNEYLASGYLDHLLSLIVNLTDALINCDICSIMVLNEEGDSLVVTTAHSLDNDYLKARSIKICESLSGQALLKRRALQWRDVTTEPLFYYHAMALKLGLRSLLSVPMLVKERPFGVINFYTKVIRTFSEEEIQFAQAVANLVALSNERIHLKKEVQLSKKNLEERKVIEKAKGILMKLKNYSEEEAFSNLRKTSMVSRKSMVEVANAIILADNI